MSPLLPPDTNGWGYSPVKTVEIAPGLVLQTRDRLDRGGAVAAIEYDLQVEKAKIIVFDVDFTGSSNLSLHGQGTSLKKRTTVEPHSRARVAEVRVRDLSKNWALETKYSWFEENPGSLLPGESKRENLGEGVVLITKRAERPSAEVGDVFTFEVDVLKDVNVTLTLDASRCVNLALKPAVGATASYPPDSVLGLSKAPTSATIVVPPLTTGALVGTLAVTNPLAGYSLKTKWTWSESSRSTSVAAATARHLQQPMFSKGESPQTAAHAPRPTPAEAWAEDAEYASSPPRHAGGPYHPAPARVLLFPSNSKLPATATSNPNNVQTHDSKRVEEISQGIVLTTETIPGEPTTEILYHLRVDRPGTQVTFEADFSGSINLGLVALAGQLRAKAVVNPMETKQVARLAVVDPALGWKLVCRYRWEETELEEAAPASYASAPTQTKPVAAATTAKPSHQNAHQKFTTLRELLASLGLLGYLGTFEQEELNLELLRVMSRDEAEFRHSLQQLGIAKMGHREKILIAVKSST